jgi:CBS domain-containing protein
MLVQEVMTKNVVNIDSNKTVFEACQEYSKNRAGSLVVTDKDILVGIITERDTIERAIIKNMEPKKTKVKDIMTPNLIKKLQKTNRNKRI